MHKHKYLDNELSGSGSSYSYDFNGNIISDSRDNIAFTIYDLDNLPVEQYKTDGTVINYGYDADGNRVMKQEGSEYNYYVRGKEGNTLAVFLDNTSNNVLINILGEGGDNLGQQMWSNWGLTHYFYLKDHLGSIKMALNQMGGVDSYNDYYPFGMQMPGRNSTASADARYKFTGKERDAETNLDYFGARYYDSWRGQWGQVDPKANKYPGWSPYNYVLDSPVKNIDQIGQDVAFHESARQNKQFNNALKLFLGTKLGSEEMKRFQNDHKIFVIYQVGDMGKKSAETVGESTLWLIGSQSSDKVIIGSKDMGISDQTFDNKGKEVITITLDSKTLKEGSNLYNAETIYHEGKAHIEFDRDKGYLWPKLGENKEHELYGTDGTYPPVKGSPAYKFNEEAKKTQKRNENQ